MTHLAKTVCVKERDFTADIFLDPFNKRIRIDDYRGNTKALLQMVEDMVIKHRADKLIVKGRNEDVSTFYELGLQPEGMIDRYFLGSHAYFFSKFYTADRKKSDYWITEDQIIHSVCQLGSTNQRPLVPQEYVLKRVEESSAAELALLYSKVFQIYPTPLHDPKYISKTMKDGTIYYAYFHQEKIVSAASAEVNLFYKNAELTDCATLPEHRKFGLMKFLLNALEKELQRKGIFCAYSIARALSFGMNAALFQLEYSYRGRLMNNCYIYDKLEDMNMWVKDLSTC
ncbi:putative beta-lysine N-acetyltransferase [Neobacillus dielmonensis]|uniref:putative beta-lysine N-acetyltransferase n=1 Tax=Neobacillus dielmonensis TaxID=1347369 RepID=UPI0005AB18A9|nr:putative beta-lysine N-acetyltransferase [Neobacillus dielmonensis]